MMGLIPLFEVVQYRVTTTYTHCSPLATVDSLYVTFHSANGIEISLNAIGLISAK